MAHNNKDGNKVLMRYAGMGFQFLVAIALALFAGIKLDEWLNISFPLLVWLLPLIIIIGVIIKTIVETNRK